MSTDVDPWRALLDPEDDGPADDAVWRQREWVAPSPVAAAGVILVIGAAGGVGASMVASGLAMAAARRDGHSLLVDLDLARGDLHGAWGMPRDRTLHDLAAVIDELSVEHLAVVATPPVDGVSLLLAPGSAHAAQEWTGDMVQRLVGVAAASGRVVVDAGRAAAAHLSAAAELADRVIVVAAPSMRSARGAAALLTELGSAATLVVNHVGRQEELGVRALGRICGARPFIEVPRRPREAELVGAGRASRVRRRSLLAAIDAILEGRA